MNNRRKKYLLVICIIMMIPLFYSLFYQKPIHKEEPQNKNNTIYTEKKSKSHSKYLITKHARQRMQERDISQEELLEAIYKGTKYRDLSTGSIAFHYLDRNIIVSGNKVLTVYKGKIKKKWIKVNG